MQREGLAPAPRGIVSKLSVIFCLLVSLGFPGNFELVYGERVGKLMEYGAFFAQILLILFSSASSWQDIELIRLDRRYAVLYLYAALMLAESMLVTAYPSEQLITCLRLLVTLLFVIWLTDKYSLDEILELIALAQGVFVLVTVLFMLRHGGLAYESGATYNRALCGLYPSKNACATELVFGIIVNVLLIRRKYRQRALTARWLALLFAQGLLLILCQATGALVTAAICVFVLLMPGKVRLPLGLIYIAVNILFLFAMLTLMPLFERTIIALGKDATLTGRIPIWNRIIEVMMEHKTLTGYGYGMFWRDSEATRLIQSVFSMRKNTFLATLTTGAHNVVLEAWLNSGLIGVAALFIAMLHSFRFVRDMEEEPYRFCLTVMAFLTVNGLTERCLGGNYDYKMVAVFLAMALGCAAAPKQRALRTGPEGREAEA